LMDANVVERRSERSGKLERKDGAKGWKGGKKAIAFS